MKLIYLILLSIFSGQLISCEYKKKCSAFNVDLLPVDTSQFMNPLKYFDGNDTIEMMLLKTERNSDEFFNISTITKMPCAAYFDIVLEDESKKNQISYFFRTYEDSIGIRLKLFIDGSETYLNLSDMDVSKELNINQLKQYRAESSERVKSVTLCNLLPIRIVYYNGNVKKLI